jgi:hypothetical protein
MEEIHMRRNTVTFDDHTYVLPPTTDPVDLQRAVVDTVTSGVGFVDVDVAGDKTMCVLVTDRMSVIFESEDIVEPVAFIGPENSMFSREFDLMWS